MVNEFIDKLKNNDEFIKAYIFKDDDQINVWVVLKDSVSDESDIIYGDFIDIFDDDECSLMIFDNEVIEYVERLVKSITQKYMVIN